MPNEITIPRLGWSMEEATFIGWLKEPGQWVAAGDVLFTLETDKATEDIEAIDAGTLHVAADAPQPGERVLVGRVIGLLLGKGESVSGAQPAVGSHAVAGLTEPGRAAQAATTSESKQSASMRPATSERATAGPASSGVNTAASPSSGYRAPDRPATPAMRRAQRALQKRTEHPNSAASVVANKRPAITPRARRTARELNIATDQLAGTGRGGRIRERDVRQAATNGSQRSLDATSGATAGPASGASSAPPATGSHNIRAAIARRLVAGLHAMAPVTLTTRADATNLVNLRAQFQATATNDATPVPSLTDVIVKLTALALERHPALNARWQDDRVVENETIAIGLAVDSEAGLFVPVLHDVLSLGLRDIAARSRALVEKARARRLTSADLEGGTFTVSNLGMLGIDAFTPIVNPPQAAVLGVGAIRREPVYQSDGSLAPRELTTLSLTFDHRVVDGAPAARFLQTLVSAIENPAAWLTS